ncbi:uncharacterized protein LOC111281852 [Durio zibethinus]|uniref:Uncharacterized protein LOC111281852 n=1 Tax=Durio zibethinus TaxID=66656 RepID=A0A6P5XA88_DURZI|nr:uncharacterized protein LOC111281852 [Durio zibethinus]XP_022725318.1 uncharacterized protein LOC111281852 [Durio zibethinus]XP_022725319.1 uncharacterized protein LOC111281852 [Durio zibethinus]XP_022725320.1 uncharacterized protein LOC111281852 [Durio zibethinus]
MTASETIGGDEGMASSPRSRVKFLCSYGGKILPRPGDANLKYVGGETRVVAVPRDIKFTELMKKLNSMVDGDMILRYQVIPEELDALVTVKSDEDLKHMVDEYDRLEGEGTPKLRAFLFPSSPVVVENQMNPVDPYIEAVNGITRPSSNNSSGRLTPVNGNRPNFSVSACSSPASPDDGRIMDNSLHLEPPLLNNGYRHNRPTLAKVQSSPSLYSLSTLHPQSNNNNHSNCQVYQPHNFYHQNHQQLQLYSVQFPKPPLEFRAEKPPGPHDFGRGPMGHGHVPINHVYSIGRQNVGNGYGRCDCCCDECLAYASGGLIRRSSLPTSGRLDKPDSPGNRMWE